MPKIHVSNDLMPLIEAYTEENSLKSTGQAVSQILRAYLSDKKPPNLDTAKGIAKPTQPQSEESFDSLSDLTALI